MRLLCSRVFSSISCGPSGGLDDDEIHLIPRAIEVLRRRAECHPDLLVVETDHLNLLRGDEDFAGDFNIRRLALDRV